MPRRIFRALVRLLPEEFRAAYARDMESTFDAELNEARLARRPLALPRLWLATITDLLRTAPGEHIDILMRDVRFALRTMVARPTHTLTAIATLALGIGANIAMFAVIDGVLLAPLPYPNPDELVWVGETESGGDPGTTGYLSFVDLRARSSSFTSLVAVSQSTATLTGDGKDAERVNAMRVSAAYFDLVGTRPILGRAFTDAEDRAGPERRVVVLGDGLWRRRFDADPSVVGRIIDMSGVPYEVIGVMAAGFTDLIAERLYQGAEMWVPLGYDPAAAFACRTCRHLRVFGRLAPGRGVPSAQAELSDVFASLENEHPQDYHLAGARVTKLSEMFLGPVRTVLLALWVGVAVLLLVACSNVASLLLLRASERSHEIAVRGALGVTRGRMARQLVTESVLLASIGGLAAWLPAWAAIRLLTSSGPSELPRLADVSIDVRVVVVALGITTISGVIFGLAPLRHLLRRHSGDTMHGAGRRTDSAATWRVRSALVAVNVAMAAVLLVGSGLLVRSLTTLLAVAPGVDPHGVVTMQIWASGRRFVADGPSEQIATAVGFYEAVLARVRALPGVTSAAAVTTLPLGGGRDGFGLHVEGRPLANPAEAPSGDRFVVTPEYFATLRIPLVRGRLIDEGDQQGRDPVVVINRTMADLMFPGEDPIGHRISLGPPNAPARRIVGIAGDVRHHGLDVPVRAQVYVPHAQWAWAETFLTLVVRGDSNPGPLVTPIREIVKSIDPAQPITRVRLYEDVVDASMGTRRFSAWLLGLFAAASLVLAVVGLYGALAVAVGQRRQEIAVRLALGAGAPSIGRMVLRQGLVPAMAGLAVGLAAAAISVGALRSLLYETRALDPLTFGAVTVLLAACALVTCLPPAFRASAIEPAAALRND